MPLRTWYDDLTGACGPSGPSPPRLAGTRVVAGELRSRTVSEPVGWAVGLPPGQGGSDAVLCLPGRGSDARWVMATLHAVDFVAAAGPRYAVAAVYGGETYWHRRASGDDRVRMLLAPERHPARFPTVAVSSAVIWPDCAQEKRGLSPGGQSPRAYGRTSGLYLIRCGWSASAPSRR